MTAMVGYTCPPCDGEGEINGKVCVRCAGIGFLEMREPPTIFRMTPEERKAIMDAHPPTVESGDVFNAGAYFNWGWKGCGFGQMSFDFDRETGIITCSNECMSRESVRKILHALADHIADVAVLDCDREAEDAAARARAE